MGCSPARDDNYIPDGVFTCNWNPWGGLGKDNRDREMTCEVLKLGQGLRRADIGDINHAGIMGSTVSH